MIDDANGNVTIKKITADEGRNVIAVASGKGGVGKTFFSVTLAFALSKLGKNTLFFDGDLGLGNVDVQLGLKPNFELGSVISGHSTLNQAIHNLEQGGFDIIAGKSGSAGLNSVNMGKLQLLRDDLMLLANDYDKSILDLGVGKDRPIRLFTNSSETIIIICTDEPYSMISAYDLIKTIFSEKPNPDIRIVVNSANSIIEGKRTYDTILKACNSFLKFDPPLLGIVRKDERVKECIRSRVSMMERYPKADCSEDMMKIAAKLIEKD